MMKNANENKNEHEKKNRNKKLCISIFLFTLFVIIPVLMSQALFAGDKEEMDEEELFWIDTIQPAPDFDSDEIDFSDAVNRTFDLKGTLDAVYKDEDRIVVGDINVPLGDKISLSSVSKGDYVGVQLDRAGKAVQIHRLQYLDSE